MNSFAVTLAIKDFCDVYVLRLAPNVQVVLEVFLALYVMLVVL